MHSIKLAAERDHVELDHRLTEGLSYAQDMLERIEHMAFESDQERGMLRFTCGQVGQNLQSTVNSLLRQRRARLIDQRVEKLAERKPEHAAEMRLIGRAYTKDLEEQVMTMLEMNQCMAKAMGELDRFELELFT
jgi:tRNA/tmRNA/rRNA uracil-C5-methylase (TrmA/RlmC/RlmD family)